MKLSSIMLAAIHFAALAQATNASTPPLLQESVVAALARLDPSPRLAVLIEAGMLEADNPALLSLKSRYEALLSAAAR